MLKVFNIQVQRADNGFIVIAQNDEPGIKNKKCVATTEADLKKAVKDFADHIFDPPPPKEEKKPNEPNE